MTDRPRQPNATSWWEPFFDDDYAVWGLSDTPPALIEQTVDFLMSALELAPGQTVFDQCCGIGRLSLPLAARGVKVVGVEQADTYVTAAQREADKRTLPCRFFRGDAFEFVAPEPCDAAINWFTSFAYLTDDSANARMLHRVFESLKPGGRFLLDFINIPQVFAQFRGRTFEESKAKGAEGLLILYETTPDFTTGMLNSDWTLIRPDGHREHRRVCTRMLLPNDLVRMFTNAGFEDVRLHGWIDGSPLTHSSRRCIVFGRKPG